VVTTYAGAIEELFRAPLDSFVAERQRLAAELKRAGDAAAAARLSKIARPSISAWAVNQLWWRARHDVENLFEAAADVRASDASDRQAGNAYRAALQSLRERASTLLGEAGHAPSEVTLRRVTSTLAALAAAGGFEPDAPGALSKDREPPGFDAMFGVPRGAKPREGSVAGQSKASAKGKMDADSKAAALARADAERRRQEQLAKALAELEHKKKAVQERLQTLERRAQRLRTELEETEASVAEQRDALTKLEAEVAALRPSRG
jgi:hypothetical protein